MTPNLSFEEDNVFNGEGGTFFIENHLKKRSTHLRHFPNFEDLTRQVDSGLLHFANTPGEITALMGKYC